MQPSSVDWISRFRALGDETRLGLLCALMSEELSVGELSEVMQAGQPGVSRHLSALRDAGLVIARKHGAATYYRIRPGDPILEGALEAELRRRSVELGLGPRIERAIARRRVKAEAFFDEQAASWDALRAQLLDQAASLSSLLPLIPRGLRVADIGTGTGGMLPQLAEFADSIVAVDISKEMLRRARARAKALDLRNVEFLKADLQSLPIASGTVDAAFATLVLHHAPNPRAALQEMTRILKPGGTVVIVDLDEHPHEWLRDEQADVWLGFTREEIMGHLASVGLTGAHYRIVSQVDTDRKTGKGAKGNGSGALKLFVASGVVPPHNRREN
jgi:ubiquinone/menaquinone biosynthesis C-methylase UbiE/DNA-binding transcriptional ArsR family regulator